jgi:hypothetical protein
VTKVQKAIEIERCNLVTSLNYNKVNMENIKIGILLIEMFDIAGKIHSEM